MASSTDRFPMCYGPEFAALAVREWLGNLGVNTAFIAPGSSWENGYVESFNSKLRDELLVGEIFYSLKEAEILIEAWRRHYNTVRLHSALGGLPPAPEVSVTPPTVWPHHSPSIAMAINATVHQHPNWIRLGGLASTHPPSRAPFREAGGGRAPLTHQTIPSLNPSRKAGPPDRMKPAS